jgi:hypothetical protein
MVASSGSSLTWLENAPPNLEESRKAARHVVQNGSRASDVFRSIRFLVQKAELRVSVVGRFHRGLGGSVKVPASSN